MTRLYVITVTPPRMPNERGGWNEKSSRFVERVSLPIQMMLPQGT